MKKKSIFSFVLAICMLVPACFMLSACKEEHKHDFSEKWTTNEIEHWHECTGDDCDEVADKGTHVAGEWIVDVNASCTNDGTQHKECEICHFVMQTESIAGGHKFGDDHICEICGDLEDNYSVKVINGDVATAYDNFDDAVANLEDNGTLVLYNNITYSSADYIVLGSADDTVLKSYTIDFNQHTIISDKGGIDLYANLTLKNGNLTAKGKNGIYVQNGATLNIEENMTVYCTSTDSRRCSGIVAVDGAILNIKGNVSSVEGMAISGNGTEGLGDVIINISGKAFVTAEKSVAIYMPNSKELNISGGTISGTTAVFIKCGITTISGGTFNGMLAEKTGFVHNGDGCDATGDAIVVEACDYPAGVPTIIITGGTFNTVDKECHKIAVYNLDGKVANIDGVAEEYKSLMNVEAVSSSNTPNEG